LTTGGTGVALRDLNCYKFSFHFCFFFFILFFLVSV